MIDQRVRVFPQGKRHLLWPQGLLQGVEQGNSHKRHKTYGLLCFLWLTNELPQHVLQDSAMLVILNLVGRVDASDRLAGFDFSVLATGANCHLHSGRDSAGNSLDIENFEAGETEARGGFSVLELQRKYSHSNQIAAMDAFEAL